MSCRYETDTAAETGRLTDALLDACGRLEADMAKLPGGSLEAMTYCHEVIIPDMAAARETADKLEVITASGYWPFPVYADLLFSV